MEFVRNILIKFIGLGDLMKIISKFTLVFLFLTVFSFSSLFSAASGASKKRKREGDDTGFICSGDLSPDMKKRREDGKLSEEPMDEPGREVSPADVFLRRSSADVFLRRSSADDLLRRSSADVFLRRSSGLRRSPTSDDLCDIGSLEESFRVLRLEAAIAATTAPIAQMFSADFPAVVGVATGEPMDTGAACAAAGTGVPMDADMDSDFMDLDL